MSDFKVGDRVRGPIGHAGRKEDGTVVKINTPDSIGVLPDEKRYGDYCCPGHPGAGTFRADRLELIEPEPEFSIGDTVKVEFEGKVTFVHDDGYLTLNDDTGPGEIINPEHVVKVEPPVTVFKPGDRLRRKNWGDLTFEITVADGGYLQHFHHGEVAWRESDLEFTSERYDKIEFAEVPF